MRIDELKPEVGSTKKKVRVGRGIGSGLGKTAGRGTKGQKARGSIHPMFEGGQTPIHRRLPVKKGFRNPNQKEFSIINLDVLEKSYNAGEEVTPENAIAKGLIPGVKDGLKILGFGELSKKLKVSAHKFSKSAEAKISSAGGEVVRL